MVTKTIWTHLTLIEVTRVSTYSTYITTEWVDRKYLSDCPHVESVTCTFYSDSFGLNQRYDGVLKNVTTLLKYLPQCQIFSVT